MTARKSDHIHTNTHLFHSSSFEWPLEMLEPPELHSSSSQISLSHLICFNHQATNQLTHSNTQTNKHGSTAHILCPKASEHREPVETESH